MKIPFKLPTPLNSKNPPIWDGRQFLIGKKKTLVLEYSENFHGWSDDLTSLHEEVAGDSHPIDIASRIYAIRQISKLDLIEGGVIIEIGCSSGFLIKDLVTNFPNATVIGADVVKAPLFNLAKTLPNVPLIRFDLLKNPLPNASADILVMLNVLEHIEDDVLALKKAFDLLKPGANLIIEVPAGKSLYDSYDKQLRHFRRYSASELKSKLESVGFEVQRKSHLGFFLFPVFAIVKLMNKLQGEKADLVQKQASKTSKSRLFSFIMKLETFLSNLINFPFGIRVLIKAKRPINS